MLQAVSRAVVAVALAAAATAAAAAPAKPAADEVAVRSIFPDADAVEVKDVILTDELVGRIERVARAKVKERLVTFYAARKGPQVLGWAVIHSHVVRTKRETFIIAFDPQGDIRKIKILAFLEPPEYEPSERWLAQFEGKGAADRLAVGTDVAPITGATLTARGIAQESRFLLHALREAAGVGVKP